MLHYHQVWKHKLITDETETKIHAPEGLHAQVLWYMELLISEVELHVPGACSRMKNGYFWLPVEIKPLKIVEGYLEHSFKKKKKALIMISIKWASQGIF